MKLTDPDFTVTANPRWSSQDKRELPPPILACSFCTVFGRADEFIIWHGWPLCKNPQTCMINREKLTGTIVAFYPENSFVDRPSF